MKTLLRILACLLFGVAFSPLCGQENLDDRLAAERRQQTGTAITIIFDDSGSMNADHKLSQAKAAFVSWLKNIPPDTKLSLITFQNGGKILIPLGENKRELVSQTVSRIVAASSTPICEALRLARQQIDERRLKTTPYERHLVLLFTDGQETQDRRGIDGVRQDIFALRSKNIEVVGVGFHGQGDYMDGVATRYYGASDEASLASGLAKIDAEIGDTSDIVVSPEELSQMKTAQPPAAFHAPSATPISSAANTSAAPAPQRKLSFGTMALIVVGILILRRLLRKKR